MLGASPRTAGRVARSSSAASIKADKSRHAKTSLVNLAIAAGPGERRDYALASIAPRHGSPRSRYLVHAAISKVKRDA
jgi:hypothetical protein